MGAPKLVHVIQVKERSMQIVENPVIVEDGISVNQIDFKLDSEWDGLNVNFFLSDGKSEAHRFNYSGEPYDIPTALISSTGVLDVGIVGYLGSDVKLTVSKLIQPFFVVQQSVTGEQEPPEPIEDIYGEIAGALNDVKELDKKVTEALAGIPDLVDSANKAVAAAVQAATDATNAATKANAAADLANDAAKVANDAAIIAGEKTVEVFNDPDADDRVIIKYPSFLKSDDGGSIYMNVSGGDYNG